MECERYAFPANRNDVFPHYAFLAMMRPSRAGATFFMVFFCLFIIAGFVIVLNPDTFMGKWTKPRGIRPSVPVYSAGVFCIILGSVCAAPFAFMLFPSALTWGDYGVFRFFHRKTDDVARDDPMRERRRLLDYAFYKPPYIKLCSEAEISNDMLKWNPSGPIPSDVVRALSAATDVDGGRWRYEAPLECFDRLCVGRGIASFDLLVAPPRARMLGFDFSVPVYSVVLDVSGMGRAELTSFTENMRQRMSKDARVLCA